MLSSAKLQISLSTTKKKISLIKILNKSGPKIEPCGTPIRMFNQLLNFDPSLTLCFLDFRLKSICVLLLTKWSDWFDLSKHLRKRLPENQIGIFWNASGWKYNLTTLKNLLPSKSRFYCYLIAFFSDYQVRDKGC